MFLAGVKTFIQPVITQESGVKNNLKNSFFFKKKFFFATSIYTCCRVAIHSFLRVKAYMMVGRLGDEEAGGGGDAVERLSEGVPSEACCN